MSVLSDSTSVLKCCHLLGNPFLPPAGHPGGQPGGQPRTRTRTRTGKNTRTCLETATAAADALVPPAQEWPKGPNSRLGRDGLDGLEGLRSVDRCGLRGQRRPGVKACRVVDETASHAECIWLFRCCRSSGEACVAEESESASGRRLPKNDGKRAGLRAGCLLSV